MYTFKVRGKEINIETHSESLSHLQIPKISLPGRKLPDIELLKLTDSNVNKDVQQHREYYAKMTLLMFYPFRTIDDLKTNGSYWGKN